MLCKKCGRRLSDPVSIKHGFGPECIKTAVLIGQAPLVALNEMSAYKRSVKVKFKKQEYVDLTCDLFGDEDEFVQL